MCLKHARLRCSTRYSFQQRRLSVWALNQGDAFTGADLLRARRKQQHGSTADHTNKFPPSHIRPWAQETASYRLKRVL